ncbi:ParB N-terminal domain-containing protein [Nesterenkonia alkaliphila]|uniref:Chromosome partitioning protein ParB n=1 Tax=Nesterenkonia alkaliphila TaxID=1463631 RepID=A0A7K1ULT6_9MICC|nr:ParB N-terminal domain-containing protein [Nesterenkonia alkaliphila]MVT27448.1 chromosome partitioning protein ParB [Nesterenkonia alkaliphila]GFZ89710.1 hypothetical protein GCM10011359_18750 [Nesterenkonia alkaliphila]
MNEEHIELNRKVEAITVGHRHRKDLGDIDALATSIEDHGLLQPPTITPEGFLVCGARRLAAVRKLGWRKVSVWVRSGLSTRLGQLMAEQDENTLHKPLSQREAAALYRELKGIMGEDATRRQSATWFSSERQPGSDGPATVAGPSPGPPGETRQQAAQMVTGRASYTTLERISDLERLAGDATEPDSVRDRARAELEAIDAGGSVKAAHQRTQAELSLAELDRISTDTSLPPDERASARAEAEALREDRPEEASSLQALADAALARAHSERDDTEAPLSTPKTVAATPKKYPVKAFLMTWGELIDWWVHYDVEELAAELTDEQLESFLTTVDGTAAFAHRLRTLRESPAETGRHLHAI